MEKFKKGEHASWDSDEEIRTREKRAAMFAGGSDDSEEEGDEEELASAVRSPKQVDLRGSSKKIEPNAGSEDVADVVREQGLVEPILSHEDITRD